MLLVGRVLKRSIDMWYFIVRNDGFEVFEILGECVKGRGVFERGWVKG